MCASTWQHLKCSTFAIHFQNASRRKYYGYGQIFTISYTHLWYQLIKRWNAVNNWAITVLVQKRGGETGHCCSIDNFPVLQLLWTLFLMWKFTRVSLHGYLPISEYMLFRIAWSWRPLWKRRVNWLENETGGCRERSTFESRSSSSCSG